jgi:4-hydroxybenzoate polyprenyltransferase
MAAEPRPSPSPRFLDKLRLTLEMIKFEHSVFALPFALTAALLAIREQRTGAAEIAWKLVWIVVAMAGARSAAMTFNRIVDQAIDGSNPRTRSRALPQGVLSLRFAWGFLIAAVALFLVAAGMLNRMCLQLAPLALAVVMLYSYTKRFTAWCHVVLGFALGIAPPAAWIAVTGSLDARILWLTAAVTLWTAGFDIIYACQDYEFDGKAGLFSVPRRLGIGGALWMSRVFHVAMVGCLIALGQSFTLGWLAWVGVGAVAALLVYEQSLVKANDLSRVNAAFFTVNGYVSVLFFLFWAAEILLGRRGIA